MNSVPIFLLTLAAVCLLPSWLVGAMALGALAGWWVDQHRHKKHHPKTSEERAALQIAIWEEAQRENPTTPPPKEHPDNVIPFKRSKR